MNENLRQGINHFVKLAVKGGLNRLAADYRIGVNKLNDGYEIRAIQTDNLEQFDLTFKFPELPDDETDAMIDLAGFVSNKITEWPLIQQHSTAGKASAAKLTPEQRSARAKKAVQARIKKYGQKG